MLPMVVRSLREQMLYSTRAVISDCARWALVAALVAPGVGGCGEICYLDPNDRSMPQIVVEMSGDDAWRSPDDRVFIDGITRSGAVFGCECDASCFDPAIWDDIGVEIRCGGPGGRIGAFIMLRFENYVDVPFRVTISNRTTGSARKFEFDPPYDNSPDPPCAANSYGAVYDWDDGIEL
jgi:hypothetical protein